MALATTSKPVTSPIGSAERAAELTQAQLLAFLREVFVLYDGAAVTNLPTSITTMIDGYANLKVVKDINGNAIS